MDSTDRDNINKEFAKVNASLSRVLYILEDDSRTQNMGLVGRTAKIEQRLDKLELEKKIIFAKASVWGAIGAIAVGLFATVVNFVVVNFMK